MSDEIIQSIGRKGLVERLTPEEKSFGVENVDSIADRIRQYRCESQNVIGIGDDFVPDSELYNALGAIYPLLNDAQRKVAIDAYFAQFDFINYQHVQMNHTPYIRESLVQAEICCRNGLYWPGLMDQKSLFMGDFDSFKQNAMLEGGLFNPAVVVSDFLVAYGVLRKDICSFGPQYAELAHKEFLDRVLLGIAMINFRGRNEKNVEERIMKLRDVLPLKVFNRVNELRTKV